MRRGHAVDTTVTWRNASKDEAFPSLEVRETGEGKLLNPSNRGGVTIFFYNLLHRLSRTE